MDLKEIMAILADPGKALDEFLKKPDSLAKIGEAISKLPPEVMGVLAAKIAEQLPKPATAKEIAAQFELREVELGAPSSNGDMSEIGAEIKKIYGLMETTVNQFNKQIMQLAESQKKFQDDLPGVVQKMVGVRFEQEVIALQQRAEEEAKKRGLVPSGQSAVQLEERSPLQQAPQQSGLLGGLLGNLSLTEIAGVWNQFAEGWSKLHPQTAVLAEDKLKAYTQGFEKGNKMRGGVVSSEDVAKDMLEIARGGKPPETK